MKHQLSITWQHIRRSPYQALGAIMVMIITSFVGLFLIFSVFGSQKLLGYLEQKPQVIVFFNDTITSEDQVKDIEGKLLEVATPAKIEFVTKEKALEIYKEKNKQDPMLLELVGANTLPASLEVSAKSVADLPKFYEVLKTVTNVEYISYQKNIVENLAGILDKIYKGGAILMGFLLVTAMLIIQTIIGMKIALRKDEIEVEKLVGASDWYIRLPFVLEGAFYGVFGATFSSVIFVSGLYLLSPYISPYLAGVGLFPVPIIATCSITGILIVACGVIGILSSLISVWRYLDE